MKLSNREKILLISLCVLILIIGYYQFALSPQLKRVEKLRLEAENYKSRIDKVKRDISPESKIHKDYKIMNSKIILASKDLFPELIQEKYITILDKMLKDTEVNAASITFTNEELATIDDYISEDTDNNYLLNQFVDEYHGEHNKKNPKEDNQKKSEDITEKNKVQVEKMSAAISFKGNYDNIIKLIKGIEDFDKKILIKSISLNQDEEGLMIGNIGLDFYAVPKIYNKDENYLNWNIQNTYGRKNPFKPFTGYTASNNKSKRYYRRNYDFFMTVKPITSDLPTVIIGKAKDTSMKTYVFADNPQFENVEFQILGQNGKYYYKYKTQSESYPQNYSGEKIEFKPKGKNVEFYVTTYKRNGKDDKSGVNLTLKNKSDLKLNIRIDYEDKNKPRVKIVRKTGDILIKRSLEE